MRSPACRCWPTIATTADGLATALVVLGPEEGLPWLASRFPGVEALFILRRGESLFEEVATPGFAAALHYEPIRKCIHENA